MKVFLAAPTIELLRVFNALVPHYKPNVLLTFSSKHYNDLKFLPYTKEHRHLMGDLILDCGAYTLHDKFPDPMQRKTEAEKLFKAYVTYLKRAQDQFDFVFSMDDRFDLDSLEHNLGRLYEMEEAGLNPVPVIHNIFDQTELNHFIDEGYKRVAIGQCKGRKELDNLAPAVNAFHEAGVKVHLFGMTDPKLIRHVKADTCDSKSWLKYATVGQIKFWNHERDKMDKTDMLYFPRVQGDHPKSKGTNVYEYDHLETFKVHLEEILGMELKYLPGDKKRSLLCRQIVNMYYYMELEKVVTNNPVYV